LKRRGAIWAPELTSVSGLKSNLGIATATEVWAIGGMFTEELLDPVEKMGIKVRMRNSRLCLQEMAIPVSLFLWPAFNVRASA